MKRSKLLFRLLPLLPLVTGIIGFALAKMPFPDGLYQCIIMYVLNYTGDPPNVLVEIARFTAPLATAGSVIALASSLRQRLVVRWKLRHGDDVALVYGPEAEQTAMLERLGNRGVAGKDRFLPARRYILLNGETENFTFYQTHADQLKGRMVYLKCASLPAVSVAPSNLKLFCPEETAARLYWQERNVCDLWRKGGGIMQIVLLGFGKLGEALLYQGLQNNIFDPEQRIEYHVFGDCAAFLATHTQLHEITDPVIPHPEPWYEALALLDQADLVIVLEQREQTALLQSILAATLRREIDVFTAEDPALALLEYRKRLRPFPWQQRAMEPELVMSDRLYILAKSINLRYAHLYSGVAETQENLQAEWEKLNAFTRGSNISAADYHVQRLQQLKALGPVSESSLTPEQLERLSHLEHIRWCRYHWLQNWRYGEPQNGKAKDADLRIHTLLVPYDALSDEEKEKDRENIRVLMGIQ